MVEVFELFNIFVGFFWGLDIGIFLFIFFDLDNILCSMEDREYF